MKLITSVVRQVKFFLEKSRTDNLPALAGQSAFFMILSVVPVLMLVISLLSLFVEIPENITITPTGSASDEAVTLYTYIVNFVLDSVRNSTTLTTIVTAMLTLWSGGRGMYIITDGILRIYAIPNRHFWVFRRIKAMGYTLIMLLMFMLCLAIMTLNVLLGDLIKSWLGSGSLVTVPLTILRYLLSIVLMTLALSLSMKLFLRRRVKLKRHAKLRAIIPGMLLVTVAWTVLSIGVRIYNNYFSGSSIYGSLGSVMITMVCVYFAMYILLCGVQLNYIYRENFSKEREQNAV